MSHKECDADSADGTSKWGKNGFGAPVAIKQSGKFSKEESEKIRNAIEEFCRTRDVTVARLCSECDHKAELKGAWMEISKCLPQRSVQSVYRHGIRKLHPFKRGAWTEEETTLLSDLVQRMGKKWSAIQAKLNRSADSCRDKYREMSEEFLKGRWKDEETVELQKYIREFLNAKPDADMVSLGKIVDRQGIQIPWSTISKKLGNRSRLSCFKKWQKMTGRSDDAPEPKSGKTRRPRNEKRRAKRVKVEPNSGNEDELRAKMAAETVEAVELPDAVTLKTRKAK
ncbi:Myb-like DNA-binding protein REB1 [Fistulifera solaris]|uniref:Myb-like DNA-binding protein REB1 n=1 Tax=Fistulifera solaris TaxID=1519565 RepID=A0A1Z5J8I1_FISSO|nr:Myb-like DNA-binding protein REB1 [Fistulifera solaris]|eukprot:GAX10256.1 Myb-like DNA-binding protein REB1 [Fistulifera solaris]